jgi:hypothetical protein
VNRRTVIAVLCAVALSLVVAGCEQLGLLGDNNKFRIVGDWRLLQGSFRSDSVYSFHEGVIKKDDLVWGSYRFAKNTVLEATIGDKRLTYNLDFPDDDTMLWFEVIQDKRIIRYEWKRE